ncbi:MAG TPA: hypothetical protein VFN42_01335 [Acetobacteraceae bacterium]|nr:hypothetical protein [Acetobacteraceae bacterium]
MTSTVPDRDLYAAAATAFAADAARSPESSADRLVSIAWASRLFALLCACVGTYVASFSVIEMRQGHASAWLLPLATGSLVAVLCIAAALTPGPAVLSPRAIGLRSLAIALLVLYAFVLLPAFGFLLASLIFAAAVAFAYAPRRLFVALGGVVMAVALWALFAYIVAEPLPIGWLWR